jgi:hypothetical protein
MLGDRRTQDLVNRYADALELGDIKSLVGILSQDVGGYVYDEDDSSFIPASINVLTLHGDKIAAVSGFLTADLLSSGNAGAGSQARSCSGASGSLPMRHATIRPWACAGR